MNCGKVLVVTAAGGGFGRLIAETLARNGCRVFFAMRGEAQAQLVEAFSRAAAAAFRTQ